MYTLEKTLADQQDLATLCADRPRPKGELFTYNSYYGHGRILKTYAGLPQRYPLKVVIPHAVYLFERPHLVEELRVALPLNGIYPPHFERIYREASGRPTALIASPFLYLCALLSDQPRPVRRGTLFFPVHSNLHIEAQTNLHELAASLAALPEQFHPITICMYWADYLYGKHQPFVEQGFRIVSAGNRYDPHFLYRFYHLCSQYQYAASNELGTSLFLSTEAGCAFFFHGLDIDVSYTKRDTSAAIPRPVTEATKAQILPLFQQPVAQPTPDQISLVRYYLGHAFLRSPRGLRHQLLAAEVLDKIAVLRYSAEQQRTWSLPPYVQRRRTQLLSYVGKIKRAIYQASPQ